MSRLAARRGGAHPRSRGENWGWSALGTSLPGSSPLTRGKLCLRRCDYKKRGLIPAHAGKTSASPEPSHSSRAHPRSRGENRRRPWRAWSRRGSSPLTRGKPAHAGAPDILRRLIPAHAGKTVGRALGRAEPGAHPRSRGENACFGINVPCHVGSSPLTRGKRCGVQSLGFRRRLIPAHAGKT